MSAIGEIPLIETARLVLTIPAAGDAGRMLDYVLRNKEHLGPWEPIKTDEYYTLEHCSDRLSLAVREFEDGKSLRLILLNRGDQSGPVQGTCDFTNIVRGVFCAAHLGYGLDKDAEGKGLMYEALTAAIAYVFDTMNLHRVMANYIPTNERSGRLLRRLGFTVEGYGRDYIRIAGKWQDHILTALINEHWRTESS